jgi:hypothetical protein
MAYFMMMVEKDPVGKGTVDLENMSMGHQRMGSKLRCKEGSWHGYGLGTRSVGSEGYRAI